MTKSDSHLCIPEAVILCLPESDPEHRKIQRAAALSINQMQQKIRRIKTQRPTGRPPKIRTLKT